MPSIRCIPPVALSLMLLIAGCAGSPNQNTSSTETTPDEPASAAVLKVLNSSEAVEEVIENDSYVVESACINHPTAVVVIRTGHHYEQDGDTREATGGTLYRVNMDLSNNAVTDIKQASGVSSETDC